MGMNTLTTIAKNRHDSFNDTERKTNYLIAAACGIILGAMLALGI